MHRFYIYNVNIITPDEVIEHGSVSIEDGKIISVAAETLTVPVSSEMIDGNGCFLAPGFIDLQLNGAFGMDFTDNPESIWDVGALLPRTGTTSFLPTIVTAALEQYTEALFVHRAGMSENYLGAKPRGFHFEGPFLNPAKKGAHNTHFLQLPSKDIAADWSQESGVSLVTLAPELPGALDLVELLVSRGVVVSAGHSNASYEIALEAFKAGVRYGTHLFNADPELNHRSPGLTGAMLTTPGWTVGLIADGIHVHPAMVQLAWKAKGPEGINLVTDAISALGMKPGMYQLAGFEVMVNELSVRLPDGTLAGSTLSTDQALRNIQEYTGCSLAEAVQSLTLTPARLMGWEQKGRVAPGCDADLVLLSADGQVQKTMCAGQLVYQADA